MFILEMKDLGEKKLQILAPGISPQKEPLLSDYLINDIIVTKILVPKHRASNKFILSLLKMNG